MNPNHRLTPLKIRRSEEQLRQEAVLFDLRVFKEREWFLLRLRMAYSAIFFMAGFAALSSYLVLHGSDFRTEVVRFALMALFVNMLGMFVALWKFVIRSPKIEAAELITKDVKPQKKKGRAKVVVQNN